MADQQKGSSQKKLLRAGRQRDHNKSIRSGKVARARRKHIQNAIRSCGPLFAAELKKHYDQIGTPGPKKS